MSQKVKAKVVKNKKKFPWGKVFYYIRSLYNNGVCFEIATTLKWFWSLIVFVLALLVSVIQPTVSAAQVKGSQLVTQTTSDPFYYGLNAYLDDVANDPNLTITFEKSTSTLSGTYTEETYPNYVYDGQSISVTKPFYSYYRNGSHVLDIYVSTSTDTTLTLNNIVNSNPNYGDASDAVRETLKDQKYIRSSSFILFTKDYFYARLYTGSTAGNSISGNYKYVLEAFPELTSDSYTLADILGYNISSSALIDQKQQAVINNFSAYLDKIYVEPRNVNTWVTFGIYAGLNGGIMIIMGLIVFVMTRGKNNPNRSIKFLQCYSIGFWTSISPAILALIFGFLIPSFGSMLFLLLYAFRVMFLSMKYLRPAYQN